MQFKKDAPVYTADDQQVGVVDRVVLDPQTNAVSHLVIRQGWLFGEDKVTPIELVDAANAERVQLRRDVKNLETLPRFEEIYYIPYADDAPATDLDRVTDQAAATTTSTGGEQSVTVTGNSTVGKPTPDNETTTYTTITDAFSLYGYPPLGLAWPQPNLGYYGYPDELYKVMVKRHIPSGAVALKEGATVVDSQGERVGTVKRIFTNDETGEATHFLVAEGWIFKEERLIPLAWVKSVTDDEVQLHMKSAILNRLPVHQS